MNTQPNEPGAELDPLAMEMVRAMAMAEIAVHLAELEVRIEHIEANIDRTPAATSPARRHLTTARGFLDQLRAALADGGHDER